MKNISLTIFSQLNSNSNGNSDNPSHSCPNCGSTNLSTGAGLKPGQISLRCSECKHFIGYRNLEKLQRLRRQKRLTPCIELLEKQGISGNTAVFILSQVGQIGGEA